VKKSPVELDKYPLRMFLMLMSACRGEMDEDRARTRQSHTTLWTYYKLKHEAAGPISRGGPAYALMPRLKGRHRANIPAPVSLCIYVMSE